MACFKPSRNYDSQGGKNPQSIFVPLVTNDAADLWGLKHALTVPAVCYSGGGAISELDADAELVAPIDQRPTRIHIHGLGSRGCRRITEYFLLVHGLGVEQVRRVE